MPLYTNTRIQLDCFLQQQQHLVRYSDAYIRDTIQHHTHASALYTIYMHGCDKIPGQQRVFMKLQITAGLIKYFVSVRRWERQIEFHSLQAWIVCSEQRLLCLWLWPFELRDNHFKLPLFLDSELVFVVVVVCGRFSCWIGKLLTRHCDIWLVDVMPSAWLIRLSSWTQEVSRK